MNLPEKMSDLLELAISDLKKCENDPKYEIGMRYWHTFTNPVCLVCLAGSVLAKTLEVPRDAFLSDTGSLPSGLTDEHGNPSFSRQMECLDYLRRGRIRDAYRSLHNLFDEDDFPVDTLHEYGVTEYKENRNRFFEDMESMVEYLKRKDL